jgi:D-proline reductase (dithiol) PrdB
MEVPVAELIEWTFTPRWQARWDEWMRPGGHGALADVRNPRLAWTALDKPLAQCTVALLTTGGVHLRGQPPFDVMKKDGDWTLREIPSDTPPPALAITHTHYNHLDADRDVNCMFPFERLRELRDQGVIGGVARTHFGMMGWIPDARHAVRDTVPAVMARAKSEHVDIMVLSPG